MRLRVIPTEVTAVDDPEVIWTRERRALDVVVAEIEDQAGAEQWFASRTHVALPGRICGKQFAARLFG
ncbi:hypothetical protein D3C80_1162910 [compost metagenome]